MYNCNQCDKRYKNPASLATHKYRYHPYLKRSKLANKTFDKSADIETNSIISRTSSINANYDELLDSQIDRNTFDIVVLNSELISLRNLVRELDFKVLLQCNDVEHIKRKTNHDNIKTSSSVMPKENSTELLAIKDQNRSNNQRLSAIEDKLEDLIKNIQDKHSVATEDVIYDIMEVKNLFLENKYDKILSDIPKLQQSVKLIINTLEMKDIITDEGIQLLEKLSESSKVSTRKLLKDNFSHLVSIFSKLKPVFDDVVYEDVSNKTDVTNTDDESEHRSGSSINSRDVTDSENDTDSEPSVQFDETASELDEQSETATDVEVENTKYKNTESTDDEESIDRNYESDVKESDI